MNAKKSKLRRSVDQKIKLLENWTKMKKILHPDDFLEIISYSDGTYGIASCSDIKAESLSWDCKTPREAIDSACAVFGLESSILNLNWSRIELELAIGGIDA